jgi:predicted ferric reductase
MKKEGIILITGIVSINLAIILLYFANGVSLTFNAFVRLFALLGLAAMFISAVLTPFQRELYRIFKAPFQKIHHSSSITGLVLITAHPVLFAIEKGLATSAVDGAAVFLPDFSSAYQFFLLAGRPAIYLIYIAFAAFFLRKIWKKGWRWLHVLNYIALLFGVIHGIMIGTDFYRFGDAVTDANAAGVVITILFLAMISATHFTFAIKRTDMLKRQRKKKARDQKGKEAEATT